MKSECSTFLRSKGKTMAVTLSDNEVSDHESGSDEYGNFITFTAIVNFITFTAIAIVDEQ